MLVDAPWQNRKEMGHGLVQLIRYTSNTLVSGRQAYLLVDTAWEFIARSSDEYIKLR